VCVCVCVWSYNINILRSSIFKFANSKRDILFYDLWEINRFSLIIKILREKDEEVLKCCILKLLGYKGSVL
jgi:hypothetical protein